MPATSARCALKKVASTGPAGIVEMIIAGAGDQPSAPPYASSIAL